MFINFFDNFYLPQLTSGTVYFIVFKLTVCLLGNQEYYDDVQVGYKPR